MKDRYKVYIGVIMAAFLFGTMEIALKIAGSSITQYLFFPGIINLNDRILIHAKIFSGQIFPRSPPPKPNAVQKPAHRIKFKERMGSNAIQHINITSSVNGYFFDFLQQARITSLQRHILQRITKKRQRNPFPVNRICIHTDSWEVFCFLPAATIKTKRSYDR